MEAAEFLSSRASWNVCFVFSCSIHPSIGFVFWNVERLVTCFYMEFTYFILRMQLPRKYTLKKKKIPLGKQGLPKRRYGNIQGNEYFVNFSVLNWLIIDDEK